MIVTFPQTLAHIENFPLLTMSGEELLLNQKRFETNLKKAGMHLASLVGHNPERYELASTYFELEEYRRSVTVLDELLVISPLHFESCLKMLEIFHQFKAVELFKQEAEYASWVLTHTQESSCMAQYCRDWGAVLRMGVELDEQHFRNKVLPLLGCSNVIPNNLVTFYDSVHERVREALRRQSADNEGGDGKLPLKLAYHRRVNEPLVEICMSPKTDVSGKSVLRRVARPMKRFNLLRKREKPIRKRGESWETDAGVRLVMICDRKGYEKRQQSEQDKESSAHLTELARLATCKKLRLIPHGVFAEIGRIGQEHPNFSCVTEQILTALHAQCLSGMAATLPPMLLYGAPGVGKTRYVKRIAAALGLPCCDIPLAGNSDAFKITGLSRYWGNAGPGMIATTFANSEVANPIFVLDEIDKVKRSENGDPLARILLLLEQETAAAFKDDFVDVPFDAEFASFIATANSIDELPEPLLNRFICLKIEPLDRQGRNTLVRTVYRELRTQQKYGVFLSEDIPSRTVNVLAECEALNGRELKRELQQAMQLVCRDIPLGYKPNRTIDLTADYLNLPEVKRKQTMGFVR